MKYLAIILLILINSSNVFSADVTYGTAVQFDSNDVGRLGIGVLDTNKIIQCYSDNTALQCRAATVSGTTPSFGTEVEIDDDITPTGNTFEYKTCTTEISTDTFAVAYTDDSRGDDGFTEVATVSGTTITSQDDDEFETGDAESIACDAINTDKWAISYNDEDDANTGKSSVCTWNGSAISCGTPIDFSATNYYPRYIGITKVADDKFLTVFESQDDADGYAVVATVSGTTPSFGTVATLTSNNPTRLFVCSPHEDTDDRFVAGFRDEGDSGNGKVRAGTISTTTITFGTEVTYNSGSTVWAGCDFVDSTQFVVAYRDSTDSDLGKSILCEVIWATRSISCGTEEAFTSVAIGDEPNANGEQRGIRTISGFDTDTPKIAVDYSDADNDYDGYTIIGDLDFSVAGNIYFEGVTLEGVRVNE